MTPRTALWLNSTVAFALAGMIAITLHELAHLITGKAFGLPATLFATAVDYGEAVPEPTQIATALAGPIFSLVFGLVLHAISGRWGRGFGRLFWMWLGLMSAQVGFGYLIIAIFARNGDTGKALTLLGAPEFVYWISLVVGIAGMLWLSSLFARRVVSYSGDDEKTMRAFGIFSWLSGTAIIVVVYLIAVRELPADLQFICLIGAVAAGIFAPMFSFFYKRVHPESEALELGIPVVGIVLLVIVAVLLTTVLASGVSV